MGVSAFDAAKLDDQLSAYRIAWNSYAAIGQVKTATGIVSIFSEKNLMVFGPTNYLACDQETLTAVKDRLKKVKTGELQLAFDDERANLQFSAEKTLVIFTKEGPVLKRAIQRGKPVVEIPFEESIVRLLAAKAEPTAP